jgi:hypothetical protein
MAADYRKRDRGKADTKGRLDQKTTGRVGRFLATAEGLEKMDS